jgi:hypothetical protein
MIDVITPTLPLPHQGGGEYSRAKGYFPVSTNICFRFQVPLLKSGIIAKIILIYKRKVRTI